MTTRPASTAPVAAVAGASARGAWERDVATFRGLPYAAAPTGARRFAAPEAHPGWRGVRDATAVAPACPQPRSRLAHVMGELSLEQDEDCLSLNVWTPAPDDARRPVLVWLHGGGFSSGSGAAAWYDGGELAATLDIVVVTINYRLGALGYLYLPDAELGPGNLGLLDQLAALRWIHTHVAAFGGDPETVTLAGQSAGGISIAALMELPGARALFRRAIIQSAPLGTPPRSAAAAEATAMSYLRALGVRRDDAGGLRARPVRELLAAQGEIARQDARLADPTPPFGPVGDDDPLPAGKKLVDPAYAADVDVLIGTTRDEMAAFLAFDERARRADEATVVSWLEAVLPGHASEAYATYAEAEGGSTPAAVLAKAASDQVFGIDTLGFAEARAARGRPAYVYRFDWSAPASPLGACHCIEMPFVFGNRHAWDAAPMLSGARESEREALSAGVHAAWGAFIRTGTPQCDELPDWPAYERDRRATMRLDQTSAPVDDLAGATRGLWTAIQ